MTVRELYTYVMSAIISKPVSNTNCDGSRVRSESITNALDMEMTPHVSSRGLHPRLVSVKAHDHDQHSDVRNKATSKYPPGQLPSGPANATYRERLGGYLHPRDMRRLMTPFGSTNEPALIVRRHVILLNFDPLRAIVLRDRLLVLVPDGSDEILNSLEKRLRRGVNDTENFDDDDDDIGKIHLDKTDDPCIDACNGDDEKATDNTFGNSEGTNEDEDMIHDEWQDIDTMNWAKMSFELIGVDCVMSCVSHMLAEDAGNLENFVLDAIDAFRSGAKEGSSHAQDRLRILKEDVQAMLVRVQGFNRALNLILDDDEDLALMNLSRLITHPERFILPVPEDVIHEESDEPELILEAYVQHGLSSINALNSLSSRIQSTEDAVSMKLDTIRNRLLYINTFVSLVSASIAASSLVGSIFGMNLINHLEDSNTAFMQVVIGTVISGLCILFGLSFIFFRAATSPITDTLKNSFSFEGDYYSN